MPQANPPRRRFLSLSARGAVLVVAWPLVRCLGGCGSASQEETNSLAIPLASLPDGARQRHLIAGVPVEIRREGDRVTARSLLCTHQGCEVRWVAEAEHYHCPCHDGTFDARGRVLGGPPTRPLRAYAARLEGDTVIVGP